MKIPAAKIKAQAKEVRLTFAGLLLEDLPLLGIQMIYVTVMYESIGEANAMVLGTIASTAIGHHCLYCRIALDHLDALANRHGDYIKERGGCVGGGLVWAFTLGGCITRRAVAKDEGKEHYTKLESCCDAAAYCITGAGVAIGLGAVPMETDI